MSLSAYRWMMTAPCQPFERTPFEAAPAAGEVVVALRVFAGSSGIYDRQQLNSVNTNQSWVGGSYPVSYSFTLSDYGQNPPLGQVHLFLIPVDHINGGLGNINQYTDYSYASNNVWLQISSTAVVSPNSASIASAMVLSQPALAVSGPVFNGAPPHCTTRTSRSCRSG